MEHEQGVLEFGGRGGVQNRVAVDAPQSRRVLIVGTLGGNLGDPCEMRQVEVEEHVFQLVACGPLGKVTPVAGGGCQVCPQGRCLPVLWAACNSSISMSLTGMSRSARARRAAGRAFRFSLIRLLALCSARAAVEKTLVDMRATAKTAWDRTFSSMGPSGRVTFDGVVGRRE